MHMHMHMTVTCTAVETWNIVAMHSCHQRYLVLVEVW